MADEPRAGPRACVIGWPIKHSRSPIIHGHWLKEHGLPGDYVIHAVAPGDVVDFVTRLADHGFVGTNVTVPHKETVFDLVRDRDPAAAATGAMNTIWLQDGALRGANTDPVGFLANLDDGAPGWDAVDRPAVVLGAGGAARGIAWALTTRGLGRVIVVNRTLGRAEKLAADLGPGVTAADWRNLPAALAGAGVLVNATTLGMEGHGRLELDLSVLPQDAVVNDIVYTPLETTLLAAARDRNLACVDGLGMLLHQAVPGFARWFGVVPKVSQGLRAAVLATLEG